MVVDVGVVTCFGLFRIIVVWFVVLVELLMIFFFFYESFSFIGWMIN